MQIQILPVYNWIKPKFKIRRDNGFAYEKDIQKITILWLIYLLSLY